jgi:hypothetical protein
MAQGPLLAQHQQRTNGVSVPQPTTMSTTAAIIAPYAYGETAEEGEVGLAEGGTPR